MISYVTAVDCRPILHCSDKNMVLTTSVAGADARLAQYLCNITSKAWNDKVQFFIYQHQQAVVA